MKKTYTPTFKAEVVLAVLKEEQTISELAAHFGVHPKLLREWKAHALKDLATLFERRETSAAQQAAHEQQLAELYAEIGRLTTQLSWLKKKLPHLTDLPGSR